MREWREGSEKEAKEKKVRGRKRGIY